MASKSSSCPRQRTEVTMPKCMESWGSEKNPNPKIGSAYHVMYNTCIHMKVEDPNIYMYKRGRIYKEPPGEI
jgi:hypothetical protein